MVAVSPKMQRSQTFFKSMLFTIVSLLQKGQNRIPLMTMLYTLSTACSQFIKLITASTRGAA